MALNSSAAASNGAEKPEIKAKTDIDATDMRSERMNENIEDPPVKKIKGAAKAREEMQTG
jgi:hypothetical protein